MGVDNVCSQELLQKELHQALYELCFQGDIPNISSGFCLRPSFSAYALGGGCAWKTTWSIFHISLRYKETPIVSEHFTISWRRVTNNCRTGINALDIKFACEELPQQRMDICLAAIQKIEQIAEKWVRLKNKDFSSRTENVFWLTCSLFNTKYNPFSRQGKKETPPWNCKLMKSPARAKDLPMQTQEQWEHVNKICRLYFGIDTILVGHSLFFLNKKPLLALFSGESEPCQASEEITAISLSTPKNIFFQGIENWFISIALFYIFSRKEERTFSECQINCRVVGKGSQGQWIADLWTDVLRKRAMWHSSIDLQCNKVPLQSAILSVIYKELTTRFEGTLLSENRETRLPAVRELFEDYSYVGKLLWRCDTSKEDMLSRQIPPPRDQNNFYHSIWDFFVGVHSEKEFQEKGVRVLFSQILGEGYSLEFLDPKQAGSFASAEL